MITFVKNILTIVFFFVAIPTLSAQESMESGFVYYHDETAESYTTSSRSSLRSGYASGSEEPVTYVDREHAFYRAPVRKCTEHAALKADAGKNDYYIVIEKSKYTLQLYNANDELLASYPIVLGNSDFADKMCEGDNKTPEGTFRIVNKRPHSEWNKFLALDYPTKESYEKFNERKAKGLIPNNARIGSGIGLHGTRAKEDITIDRTDNWTYGCVSTKNSYIDELYEYIPVGTKVIIKK